MQGDWHVVGWQTPGGEGEEGGGEEGGEGRRAGILLAQYSLQKRVGGSRELRKAHLHTLHGRDVVSPFTYPWSPRKESVVHRTDVGSLKPLRFGNKKGFAVPHNGIIFSEKVGRGTCMHAPSTLYM